MKNSRHVIDSRDKMTTMTSQCRSCDACVNRNAINGQKIKLHTCHHKHLSDISKSPSNGGTERNRMERKPMGEMTLIMEKRKFCGSVCCASQESPSETFAPPTPVPVISNSSDENKTEYYPDDPEKYMKEIKLRIMQREKDCR